MATFQFGIPGTSETSNQEDQVEVPPKKRKTYDIWSRLNEAEALKDVTGQLGDVKVDGDLVRIERGPESYYVHKRVLNPKTKKQPVKKRKKQNVSQPKRSFTKAKSAEDGDLEDGELPDGEESDSSISSGGISDNSMALLKTRIGPTLGKDSGRSEKKPNEEEDEGQYKFDYDGEETLESIIAKMGSELKEKNVKLLNDVVNCVGVPAASKILKKVLKVEKCGGLMVKDGTRRRTPGGTFFYIIQRHPKTKSKNLDKILRDHSSSKAKLEKKKARANAKAARGNVLDANLCAAAGLSGAKRPPTASRSTSK